MQKAHSQLKEWQLIVGWLLVIRCHSQISSTADRRWKTVFPVLHRWSSVNRQLLSGRRERPLKNRVLSSQSGGNNMRYMQ
jgi:hypothetical protein